MKDKKHLPIFGVGPVYVWTIALITLAGVIISATGHLPSGEVPQFKIPFIIIGIILITLGIYMWINAVLVDKIDKNIKENTLVTTGVYSWVRNPIYSAISIALIGVCFLSCNLWMFVLPPFYWVFLTILIKFTEERWLKDFFGEEYLDYCKRTNRCIPWFPKNKK